MNVAVVGAGAVGATAARDLAARGAGVALFERATVGSGATGRAAGIVYDAFAGAAEADLARRAGERFRALSGTGAFSFDGTPYVWFATEPGETAAAIRGGVERMRDRGSEVALVDPPTLRARFPQVAVDDVHTAAVAERAGVADPGAYAAAMADAAREAGATLHEGTPVAVQGDPPRVLVEGAAREFDAVAVAAGARTRTLLADAGVALALRPYRTQALLTSGPAVPSLYDATDGYYLRPHRRGIVAGDGTERVPADPEDWTEAADEGFLDAMRDRLAARLVNFEGTVSDAWAGLCTATPDGAPLLGPVGGGLHVAAGWHGHGFMLAPATGEVLAEEMLGGDGIEAFDPRRFDGDEPVEIVEGMAPD